MDHTPLNLPIATSFWVFVGVLGQILVVAGLVFFLLSFIQQVTQRFTRIPFFALGCASIFGVVISLGSLFVFDQFEYEYVFAHSEKINAVQYKIAAIWSGQQGSFLLWATTSAIFALLAGRGTGPFRRGFTGTAAIFLASLCGILAFETPFKIGLFEGKHYIPPDGSGLAPSLNNYWVVIHPPTIFLGFGSLIVLFAYAMSAMLNRDYEGWLPRVRPWALVSIAVLGLGLCMGGFWAYETLNWGGFWMWDPVENVSFVPWVIVVALVHGIIVQTTKKKWHFTNLLLAGAPFLAFTYGTFLTRSGFLADVSVHSFATMDSSAHKVLLGLVFAALGAFLGLWFHRMAVTKRVIAPTKGIQREGAYQLGMIFLVMTGAATAIGMSVPLFQAMRGQTVKVVEEHLYHLVLSVFFIPTMILMAVTPFMSWRQMQLREFGGRLLNVFSLTLGLVGIAMFVFNSAGYGVQPDKAGKISIIGGFEVPLFGWIVFLFGLCTFVAVANLWRLIEMIKRTKPGVGAFVSHLGVAVALAGLIVSRGFERKQYHYVQSGVTALPVDPGGTRNLIDLIPKQDWNFESRDNQVALKFSGDGPDFVAKPGLYYIFRPGAEPQAMVWPHIQRYLSHDMYIVIHPLTDDVDPDPTPFLVNQTHTLPGYIWENLTTRKFLVTYLGITRTGEPGQAGTSFGAKLKVADPEGHSVIVTPTWTLKGAGEPMEQNSVKLDDDFSISLDGMDAATKSVKIRLKYNHPVFPVETFYKPMTILVWLGVGILTFGGLLSAWYRRFRKPIALPEAVADDVEIHEDALVPVA